MKIHPYITLDDLSIVYREANSIVGSDTSVATPVQHFTAALEAPTSPDAGPHETQVIGLCQGYFYAIGDPQVAAAGAWGEPGLKAKSIAVLGEALDIAEAECDISHVLVVRELEIFEPWQNVGLGSRLLASVIEHLGESRAFYVVCVLPVELRSRPQAHRVRVQRTLLRVGLSDLTPQVYTLHAVDYRAKDYLPF